MKVKYSHIFWGSVFILLGFLFLIHQFKPIIVDVHYIINLWPIFVIAIGLFYFNLPKFLNYIISSVSGLLLGLMIFGIFNHQSHPEKEVSVNVVINETNNQKFPVDTNFKEYFLDIDFGAGELKILDKSQDLFELVNLKPNNLFEIIKSDSNKNRIELSAGKDVNINDNFLDREGIIRLNPDVIWNIESDLGAVSSFLDFSNNKIRNLHLNCGASSIGLKIGERLDTSNLNIECGASKIEILIPFNSGCKIVANSSLSKNKFKDFIMVSEDNYQTDNFEQAKNKIFINFDGGVSKFIVKRY